MATILNGISGISSSACSYFQKVRADYLPSVENPIEKIKKVALGALTTLVAFPAMNWIQFKAVDLMKNFNITFTESQDAVGLLKRSPYALPSDYTDSIVNATYIGFICIVGPAFEELIFRNVLHESLRNALNNPDSRSGRILHTLACASLFGLIHLSPQQGWANVPILIQATLMGGILTTLRDATGDTIATTTAHILYNAYEAIQTLT